MMVLHGTHDLTLASLSVAIAVAASFTALDLSGRIRVSSGRSRWLWLATAAVAMGGGIWAMHFVAMLAFSVPGMNVSYDPALTVSSLLVAVATTGGGFAVMGLRRRSPLFLLLAGLLMGAGVVTMHYLGMAAMRMPMAIRYDGPWVALSMLIAIGAATAALWLTTQDGRLPKRLAASGIMGSAIAGMHYAGMHAAVFTASRRGPMPGGDVGLNQVSLAFGIAAATFLILFVALVAAMFDRRFARAAMREAVALRRSEERFRSLYRGTPLPLHSLDKEGRIEQVSNTWLELMGYRADDVIGRPLFHFLTERSARQFMQADWPELMERGYLSSRDYKAVTRSGAFLDVVAAARVEHDEQGRFLHALGGLTDVTERRRAEEALRQAQKIEAIGHLTGGVAHDFNNLLAVVIGNLDLLRKRLDPIDPRHRRLLDNALEGANRGASLTQRLLSFARRQDLRPEAVDVAKLVHGMGDLLQRSLGPMVRVEARFPLDLPPARVDAHQLELALVNLGVNARDAMPDGGVWEIAAAVDRIDLAGGHGLAAGAYVKLSLRDHGTGMDGETLARATEPFFTTKGLGKGTGLGLPMVQGLAAQSGGKLSLRSGIGQGTTAELWLPVAIGAPQAAPVPAQAPVARFSPATILVVDDDPLVLANTAAVLDDLGHRVITASSGMEALARLADGPTLDLLVTDQLMPHMTGVQLVERVRAMQPGLPALIVSGYSELAETELDVPLLRKPFTQSALAAAVARVSAGPTVVPISAGRRQA
jgi:PAS domain S-box-containing protein